MLFLRFSGSRFIDQAIFGRSGCLSATMASTFSCASCVMPGMQLMQDELMYSVPGLYSALAKSQVCRRFREKKPPASGFGTVQ